MKYQPIFKKNLAYFKLEKPIYGNFFGIWDKWFYHIGDKKIIIDTPNGRVVFNSLKEFLKGAKRLKRFYKNPDEPMIFYARDLTKKIDEYKKEILKKEQEKNQISIFNLVKTLPEDYLKEIKKKLNIY